MFKKILIGAGAVALISSLAGCATANADKGFAFVKNPGMGLLAGSLTSTNPGNFFSQDINVFFTPVNNPKASRVHLTTNDHCSLSNPADTDFKDQCGKVFAVAIPAGDYVLDTWNIVDAGGGAIVPEHWDPVKITVQAGKLTYVGNIHMVFDPNIPGGGPDGWHGWPATSDRHERDIPMLLSRYPALQASDVVMESLTLPPSSMVCNTGNVGVISFKNCGG